VAVKRPITRWKTASGQKIESAREAWANPDGAEVAAVAGENAVNPPPLGYGSHRPVNQSEIETLEFGIQLQCPGDVAGKRQFKFVACGRVKDFGDESAHCLALRSQEIVYFRQDQRRDNHGARRNQNSFVFRKARLAGWRARQRAQQAACIGNDRRNQSSMSRKS